MIVPYFIFTKYPNSFSVYVKNLEDLSVEQIQKIEAFVKERKGIFDFSSYAFVIQKRLEFGEFVSLLQKISINAKCEEKFLKTQQTQRVEFGKYKGLTYSDLPDSYLLWLKSNYKGKNRDAIDAELHYREL
ncbi:hypothetical protein CVO_04650 [Sulfurimonas sp. CVO]|jgi:hypothetical protein|uniref:putative quorum-sensing-regulated virulence factor n=1 Tax=Sulfurimonas sp. CVO TaxID=2283483 RepID=UPI000CC01612|nr:DUF3820 family protein [Sulfurimonas sp. CVO]PLY13976.1 MAG: hypothetical protein C0628_05195 [Sulfurimonas sp.]QHG91173.1 hypothetical protein CVO_04650 [Sulfurimonas sp. CVO]